MAATGNEIVLLKQLKLYNDKAIKPGLDSKLDAPKSNGTDGQILVYFSSGNRWVDLPQGTEYSADNATLQLSGTQFSVKDLGITAAKIANGAVGTGKISDGAVTAEKMAEGVIPDVSGFVTKATADATYQPKGSYLTSVPKATSSVLGGIMVGYAESGKNYPVELDSAGKAFVNVPWTDTNTTYEVATTSTDGLMSSEDKTKLDGLSNYTLPTVSDGDFDAYMGIA